MDFTPVTACAFSDKSECNKNITPTCHCHVKCHKQSDYHYCDKCPYKRGLGIREVTTMTSLLRLHLQFFKTVSGVIKVFSIELKPG